jgi:N-methylhydantoinase B
MRGKERYRFQPWGAAGGRAGSLGSTFVEEQGRERDIGKTSVYRPVAGAVLTIRGAGGGGFGAPSERDPERVRRDVLDGLVSPDRARAVYGVVLAGSDIDVAATSALRADSAGEAGEAIDLGRGRRAWEAEWGQTADAVTEWLAQLPARLRPVAKTTAWSELKASGAGKGWDDARLRAFLAGLEPQFRSGSTHKH